MARPPLVLDLGNVLVDLDFEHFVQGAAATSPRPAGDIRARYIAGESKRRFERGEVATDAFFAEMAAWLAWPAGREDELVTIWCDIFTATPGAQDALERLARTWPVWMLSDTNPAHLDWCLGRWPWLARCERRFVSYDHGRLKAETGGFAPVLAAAGGARPVFYDDLPANVSAARAAGLDARLFTGWHAALRALIGEDGASRSSG